MDKFNYGFNPTIRKHVSIMSLRYFAGRDLVLIASVLVVL